MGIKNTINNLFKYEPPKIYDFSIIEDKNNTSLDENSIKEATNIYTSINVNEEYIKTRYNTLINSDIIIRNFILNARGKQYNAFLLYIDGMVDSQLINDYVLESLMLRNKANIYDGDENRIISEAVTNNITVRKVKKFDLVDYIYNSLIPENNVKKVSSFEEIITGVNSRKLCPICRYYKYCI